MTKQKKTFLFGALTVAVAVLALVFALVYSDMQEEKAAQPTAAPTVADATTEAPADDDFAYITEKGTMVIGYTVYEPMNFLDASGKLTGFDTEFAEAVCAKLGVKPEFVEINWDTKEVELKSKTIDCIWNGLTINDERRANMDFSNAYIKNTQVAIVKADNAAKYTDAAAMAAAKAKFVAETESAGEGAIKDNPALAGVDYTAVPLQSKALMEVKAGTADVAVLDSVMAKAMVGEGTDYADLVIVPGDLAVEEYGIGFRLGSTTTAKVNAAIDELIADGTLNTIAAKYELADRLVAAQ